MAFFALIFGAAGASGSVATAAAAERGGSGGGWPGGSSLREQELRRAFAAGVAALAGGAGTEATGAAGAATAGVVAGACGSAEFPGRSRLTSIHSPFECSVNLAQAQMRRRPNTNPRAPRLPSIARRRRFQLGANSASTTLRGRCGKIPGVTDTTRISRCAAAGPHPHILLEPFRAVQGANACVPNRSQPGPPCGASEMP